MAENRSYQELDTDGSFPMTVEAHKKVLTEGMPTLWHEAIEIKLFFSSGTRLVIGNEVYTAEAGDIFVINPCEPHSTYDFDGKSDYHMIDLDAARLWQTSGLPMNEAVSRLCAGTRRIRTRFTDEKTRALIEEIAALADEQGRQFPLLGAAYLLLDDLLRNHSYETPSPGVTKNIMTRTGELDVAITYIHRHYTEKIRVSDLADLCAVSEKYFCKLFRMRMHMTAVEYINTLRLRHALLLIESSDRRIADAAEVCGFPDVNYFFRVFKKYMGETVTSYLKRQNGTKV